MTKLTTDRAMNVHEKMKHKYEVWERGESTDEIAYPEVGGMIVMGGIPVYDKSKEQIGTRAVTYVIIEMSMKGSPAVPIYVLDLLRSDGDLVEGMEVQEMEFIAKQEDGDWAVMPGDGEEGERANGEKE